MKTIEKRIFVTDDGMEFMDEESARRHEMNLKNILHFLVSYNPDRTETGRYTQRMAIAVHTAQKCHKNIIYQYLTKKLHWNPIIKGVQGYGYMSAFAIEAIDYKMFKSDSFIENQRLFLSEIDVKGYPPKTNIIDFVAKDTVEMD